MRISNLLVAKALKEYNPPPKNIEFIIPPGSLRYKEKLLKALESSQQWLDGIGPDFHRVFLYTTFGKGGIYPLNSIKCLDEKLQTSDKAQKVFAHQCFGVTQLIS